MCDRLELENKHAESGDLPGDPLFPLMPRVIEEVKARLAERRAADGTEGLESDEGPQDDYSMILETLCGAIDDSQPVEQYNGALGVPKAFVDAHQSAVGQIQWNSNLSGIYTNPGNVSGARWCSGTLITNDLFLTAGHCFDQSGGGWQRPRVNGSSNVIPSTEIATNMHVNFNYQVDPQGNLRQEQSFPIIALLEYRLGGLDFAIVRLGGNPGATFGTTGISTTDAAAGDMLCIMGHPEGVPKRIEAGPALAPDGNRVRYNDIDTLGGNSGSGVLRATDGRIIGVHTNGGCTPQSPSDSNANFGMRIAAVIAASPTLKALIQPTNAIADTLTSAAQDVANPKLKVTDDVATTVLKDVATSVLKDLIRDPVATLKAADIGGTVKFLDDVKFPGLDKNPASDATVNPGGFGRVLGSAAAAAGSTGAAQDLGTNPRGDVKAGPDDPNRDLRFTDPSPTARPFVLSTPHHSMAWSGEASQQQSGLEEYEAGLQQIAETISQYEQALQTLHSQFEQLVEEYRQAGGQG